MKWSVPMFAFGRTSEKVRVSRVDLTFPMKRRVPRIKIAVNKSAISLGLARWKVNCSWDFFYHASFDCVGI